MPSHSNADARNANVPSLLTEANRSASRRAAKRTGSKARALAELSLPAACRECGVVLGSSSRKYCDECFSERRTEVVANFANAGPIARARQRAGGNDPAHTSDARSKQGRTAAQNAQANAEWTRLYGHFETDLDFTRDILPGLRALPLNRIMEATGLSLRYVSLIRRDLKVPHPRHWSRLTTLSCKNANEKDSPGSPREHHKSLESQR
jgi:hypothetical protein